MMPFARSGRQQPAGCGVFSIRVNEEQQRLMLLQCSALTCRYQYAHIIALNTPRTRVQVPQCQLFGLRPNPVAMILATTRASAPARSLYIHV